METKITSEARPVRTWKDIGSHVLWIAVGFFVLWFTWATWQEFAELESGQRESLKVWAPIAEIYKLGGIWTTIAKWAFVLFFGLCAVAVIYIYGRKLLFPSEYDAFEDPPWKPGTIVPPLEPPYDRQPYHVTVDLEVTRAQVANAEEVVIAGPNGGFAIKLHKKYRNGRLVFQGQGREYKGDLHVNLKIREV